MDSVITTSKVIMTTPEQVQSFSAWATGKYSTYKEYANPTQTEEIAVHIRTNIFTTDMKSIWRESEPYVGLPILDLHMSRVMIYRKRLEGKIKYMREKLGMLAFPVEAAQIRERQRIETARRRMQRHAPREVVIMLLPADHYNEQQGLIPSVVMQLSDEEATSPMEEDCVICMSNHTIVESCMLNNCGHRFGATCFEKWSHKHANCPLCRKWCTEITKYTSKENKVE